jgi:hypothetical protein
MIDLNMLATVASIIAGFGAAMLAFRPEREVRADDEGEPMWIAWADWLIIGATLLCLVGLFPIVSGWGTASGRLRLASATTTAAVLLTFGYLPSILAHYRLILRGHRRGLRKNPEPPERWLTVICGLGGLLAFLWRLLKWSCEFSTIANDSSYST